MISVRTLVLGAIAMLAFATHGAAQATDLASAARQLVDAGRIELSGNTMCRLYDGAGQARDAFVRDNASALLNVARERRIYVLVHGFHVRAFGGRPSEDDVRDTWSGYEALVRASRSPAAVCLMRFDTRLGFGDHQPELGNFLHALRWLTDDPQLFDPERQVYLVGHSAGGNYIKHGLRLFQRNLEASGAPEVGRAPTRMRVLTLATPHYGTSMTWTAGALAGWYELFVSSGQGSARSLEERQDQRWRERVAAEWRFIAESPGARQLALGSGDLRALNDEFLRTLTPNVQVLALAGRDDAFGPPAGAAFRRRDVIELVLPGQGHFGLLQPDRTVSALVVPYLFQPAGAAGGVFERLHAEVYGSAPTADTPAGAAQLAPPARMLAATAARFALAAAVTGRSPLAIAAERYLRARADGAQDEAALVALADAIAVRVQASGLPMQYTRPVDGSVVEAGILARNAAGEEELRLWRIASIADGDPRMVPRPISTAAAHLKSEITALFGPRVPLINPWSDSAPRRTSAPPEERIVRPRPVEYRGAGGLLDEELVPISEAVNDLGGRLRSMYRNRYNQQVGPSFYVSAVGPLAAQNIKVIKARYRTQDSRSTSFAYYFWFKGIPDAVTPEFLGRLAPNHPLFWIRDPRDFAPERQPPDDDPSALVKYANSGNGTTAPASAPAAAPPAAPTPATRSAAPPAPAPAPRSRPAPPQPEVDRRRPVPAPR